MKRENRIFLVLAVLIVFGFLLISVTTPAECKVSVDKMSTHCKELRFP